MGTKNNILAAAARLMNERGMVNVTLRDVANEIQKSYGNITYHFGTKEVLLQALFDTMDEELRSLQQFAQHQHLFLYLLQLPSLNFEISTRYLFFTTDLQEIKRQYPDLFQRIDALNQVRKQKWLQLLLLLQDQGYFRKDLQAEDFDYIMLLSTSVRTFYLQWHEPEQQNVESYATVVNKLLYPYLTENGREIYRHWKQLPSST